METLLITVRSYNERSLNKFYSMFKALSKNKYICLVKTSRLPKIKKITSILKSPHINKTAQEHFEERLFTGKIIIQTKKSHKTLIILKKVFLRLFRDLKISVQHITSEKINENISKRCFKKSNFKTKVFDKKLNTTTPLFLRHRRKICIKRRYADFKIQADILNSFGETLLIDCV